jgi:phospholipase/carboxylesterase
MRLAHALSRPEGDGSFPALVAFHGYGGNAVDMLSLIQPLVPRPALVICPQGPLHAAGDAGFSWYRVLPGVPRDWDEFERMAATLREFVDEAVEQHGADRRRVVLLGFSAGGRFAYRLGLSEPERYAGLAALSTTLADEIARHIAPGDALGRLPVLIHQGSTDTVAPVQNGRGARERLRTLGLEAEYEEYPMGHEIGAGSSHDLTRWLDRVLA